MDAPKGTKLYSTVNGEVIFQNVASFSCNYPITTTAYNKNANSTKEVCFAKDGTYTLDYDGECVLFPSKDQRDWSKFKVPIKKFNPKDFKPFDKVLLRDGYGFKWHPTFLEKILKEPSGEYSAIELINGCKWDMCIPYNEETKNLCWTTNDCPKYYKWWEDK